MTAAVLAAVFYGDLFLGVTIPLAVLLLPAVVFVRLGRVPFPRAAAIGLFGLAVPLLCVAAQSGLGFGPRGRSDLVVYLPLVYAFLTVVAVAGAWLHDQMLRTAVLTGVAIGGVSLLAALSFAPQGTYAVPGQNPERAIVRQAETRQVLELEAAAGRADPAPNALPGGTQPATGPQPDARRGASPPALGTRMDAPPAGAEPGTASGIAPEIKTPEPDLDPTWKAFYTLKNRARTPLGQSNYLAVMFVFVFNVLLYQRSRWVLLPLVLTLLTFSRSGLAFLVLSGMVWAAVRHRRLRSLAAACSVGAVGLTIGLWLFWSQVSGLPGMESLGARAWYLTNAFEPIAAHPWLGAPRSEIMRQFGYPITWTPHTSVLHLIALFGVVGAFGYASYLGAVLAAVRARARTAALWQGALAGLCIALLWSTVEIIVLTPAFEILTAAMYAMALRMPPTAETQTPG